MDDATIGIKVDTKDVERGHAALDTLANKGASAEKSLGNLGSTAGRGGAGLSSIGSGANNAATGLDNAARAASGVASSMRASNDAAALLSNSLRSLSGAFGAAQLIGLSDQYTKFTAQLRLATNGAEDYAKALDSVQRISTAAQQPIGQLGVLYGRIATATTELGISQKQLSGITETVGLALKVSGATTAESASAMLQLSQAFASGVLRGEEFNAVNEAAPRLMKALADGIGVPTGALRKMAEAGELTSKLLAEKLPGSLDALRKEAKEVETIGGAFTVLKNNVLEFVGGTAQSSGTVKVLTTAIGGLADNLTLVAGAALTLTAVKVTTWLESGVTGAYANVAANRALALSNLEAAQAATASAASESTLAAARVAELRTAVLAADGNVALAVTTNGLIPAQARAAVAAEAHAAALAGLAVAQKGASVSGSIASTAMGALGGPIGLITTLLGIGATAWLAWGDAARKEAANTEKTVFEKAEGIIESMRSQIKAIDQRNAALNYKPESGKADNAQLEAVGALQVKIDALNAKRTTSQQDEAARLTELNKLLAKRGQIEQTQAEFETKSGAEKARRDAASAGSKLAALQSKEFGISKSYLEDLKEWKGLLDSGAVSQDRYVEAVGRLANATYKASTTGKEDEKQKKAGAKASSEMEGAAKREQSAYDRLIASIKTKIEENDRQVSSEEALNGSEKIGAKLKAELEQGSKKMTSAHRAEAEALLQSLGASERALEIYKAQKKFEDQRDKGTQGTMADIAAIQSRTQALEDEAKAFGRSAGELQKLAIARLEVKASNLAGFDSEAAKQELDFIQQKIDALKLEGAAKEAIAGLKINEKAEESLRLAQEQALLYRGELELTGLTVLERQKVVAQRQIELKYAKEIAAVKRSGASEEDKAGAIAMLNEAKAIEASAAVNKVVQDDWAKTSEQINQSLTDALMRGFEGGKDAAKNMRDTIVNMFETMVLKPVINAVMSPVSGAITGAVGSFGSQAAGQTGTGILGSLASSAIGTAITGGFAQVAAGYSGATLAAGLAGPTTAGATGLMGIGNTLAAIPGWGWAALGAAAVASFLANGGETRTGSRLETTAAGTRYAEGPSGGRLNATLEDKLTKSAFDGINSLLKNLGSKDVLGKFVSGLETSGNGRGGVFAGGTLSGGAKFGDVQDAAVYKFNKDLKPEDAIKAYAAELNIATVEALKAATDLPKYAQRVLGGLDMAKLTPDAAVEALQVISGYPSKLLELAGTSRDALVEQFTTGLMDKTVSAQKAGQNVADTLVASIEQAVMQNGMAQIFDIVNNGIVTPVIDAMLTGQALSEAISQESIDRTIAAATAKAQALGALFNDATFQGVLAGLKTTVGAALGGAAGQVGYEPKYQLPDKDALKKAESEAKNAAEEAAKAAEEARKKWQDITDNLIGSKLQLGIDLLRAQGKEEAATAAERAKAIDGFDAYQVALYDTNQAIKKQIATQESLNALTEESRTLGIQNLRAMGLEEQAIAEERSIATKGMGAAEISVYDFNRALEKQIATQESLTTLKSEGASLEIEWLRATGKEESALAAERVIATKGMGDLEKKQYDANKATEKLTEGFNKMKSAAESALNSLGANDIAGAKKYIAAPGASDVDKAAGAVSVTQDQISAIRGQYQPIIDLLAGEGIKKTVDDLIAISNDQLIEWVNGAQKLFGETSPDKATAWITGLERIGALNSAMATATESLTAAQTGLADAQTEAADKSAKAAIDAAKESADAAKAMASFNNELANMRTSADISLARAMGDEEKALSLERQNYVAGLYELTDAQKSAKTESYDYVQTVNAQIKAQEAMNALNSEGSTLAISLLHAQGKEESAVSAERAKAIKGMTGLAVAQYDANKITEKQIADQNTLNGLNTAGTDLAMQLLRAQGNEEQALAIERTAAIKGMTGLAVAQYDLNQAMREQIADIAKAKEVAAQRAGLESQLHQLLGNTNALRDQELKALDPTNRALQQRIWGLEDAKAATISALEGVQKAVEQEKKVAQEASDKRMDALNKQLAIAQQRAGIEQSALQLLGNTTALRQRELDALDSTNRALQQRIWAVEDSSTGVDKALAAVQRSIGAEKTRIADAAQAQIDAINAGAEARSKAIDIANESVSDLTSLFDDIASAVKALRQQAVPEAMQMAKARAYISMALSVAQAGGSVNPDKLREAMGTVTGDTADTYRTGADFRFAQARQASELEQLGTLTGGKKDVARATLDALTKANDTAAEQIKAIESSRDAQIKALDAQQKTAEDAVAAMRGADLSIIAVGASITGLDSAMAIYEAERDKLGREQLATGYDAVSVLERQITQEKDSLAATLAAFDAQYLKAQEQVNAINGVNTSVLGVSAAISGLGAAISAQAAAQASAAAAMAIQGASSSSSAAVLPSFAVGTNRVPHDMIAQIHEGEAIIPRAFNPWVGMQQADQSDMIHNLILQVQELQQLQRESNKTQQATHDILDQVTEGGNAIRSDVVATV